MTFNIDIPAVKYGQKIDPKYTCRGQDINPQVKWVDPPQSAKSFVLVMEDPDAPRGTFVHWVLYNIPQGISEVPEGLQKEEHLPNGWVQGKNDFGRTGYGGPCPPGRSTHRYFVYLYAVNRMPDLQPGLLKAQVMKEIERYIVKQVSFMFRFGQE
ncbi:YbhB/YbcL family Raf kinase inhibitor-like protein [Thermogymnomonas acidicola]|nr:YbhB/YbcL family Raf kinase inhibitor-like protein [Thermogymnomonas acidicola]